MDFRRRILGLIDLRIRLGDTGPSIISVNWAASHRSVSRHAEPKAEAPPADPTARG